MFSWHCLVDVFIFMLYLEIAMPDITGYSQGIHYLKTSQSYSSYEQDDNQFDEKLANRFRSKNNIASSSQGPKGLPYHDYYEFEYDATLNLSDAMDRYLHPVPRNDDEMVVNITDLFDDFDPDEYSKYDNSLRKKKKTTKNPRTYNFVKRNKLRIPLYNTTALLPPRDMTFRPSPPQLRFVYAVAPFIIDAVAPHQKQDFVDQGMFDVSQYKVRINAQAFYKLSVLLAGPLAFIIFFLALAALMIFFARAAYRFHKEPRKHSRPFERKCDRYVKCCLLSLFFVLMSLYILSVIGAYRSELHVEEAVDNLGLMVCNMTRTVSKELQKTTRIIWQRWHPSKGVPPTMSINETDSFQRIWNFYFGKDPAFLIKRRLGEPVRALSRIVLGLEDVRRDLADMERHGAAVAYLADQFNKGLRKVKQELLLSLARCDLAVCVDLQRKYHIMENFDIDVPLTHISGVSSLLENVTQITSSNIKQEVAQTRMNVQQMINKYGRYNKKFIDLFSDTMDHALDLQGRLGYEFHHEMWFWLPSVYASLENIENYRIIYENHFAPYIKYIAFATIVLTPVPLVLMLGLPWGVLGTRAAWDGKVSVFSKSCGARLIYCTMFLVIAMLTIYCCCTVLVFTVGIFIQRGICDPFQAPHESALFRLVDDFYDIEKSVFKEKASRIEGFNVSRVLLDVYHLNGRKINIKQPKRRRLYETLHIMRMMHLPRYRFYLKKKKKLLRDLKSQRQVLVPRLPPRMRTALLNETTKRKLLSLAQTRLMDLDIHRIPAALKINMHDYTITSQELEVLARILKQTAKKIAVDGVYHTVPEDLSAAASHLLDLRQNVMLPMLQHSKDLNDSVCRLMRSRRLGDGGAPLGRTVEGLMDEVEDAEHFFNESLFRQYIYKNYIQITYKVKTVFRHVVPHALPHDQFLVVPIGNMYLTVCEHLLLPIHGMWICLALCSLLLLPLLLVSRNLSRHFLRPEPYPGPAVVRAYDQLKRYKREVTKHRRRGKDGLLCAGVCNAISPPAPPGKLPPRGGCEP